MCADCRGVVRHGTDRRGWNGVYGEQFFAWEEISASFPELSLYRYRNVDDWEVCPADSGG